MAASTPSKTGSGAYLSRYLWMVLATLGAAVVIVLLLIPLGTFGPPDRAEIAAELQPVEIVEVVGTGRISIRPDTAFAERKLAPFETGTDRMSFPMLTLTGLIIARSDTDESAPEDRWQFSTTELQALYTDWIKSESEVRFARKQLEKSHELLKAQLDHHETIVRRLRGLVEVGTDSPRELIAAEAEKLQAEIEGERQIYEAELAANQAERDRTSLERQLAQAGVLPRLLRETTESDVVIALADVPEIYIPVVRVGQSCRVRFFGDLTRAFDAEVKAVSPSLSEERRTLRVLFEFSDPEERLIPGMFAQIDVGTEERDVLLVPMESVLHIGRSDYVLVRLDDSAVLEVRPVRLGRPHGRDIEVLEGLTPGETVVGSGMILLKPFVVRALAY